MGQRGSCHWNTVGKALTRGWNQEREGNKDTTGFLDETERTGNVTSNQAMLCNFRHRKTRTDRGQKNKCRRKSVWGGTDTHVFTSYTKYQRQQQPPCNKTKFGHPSSVVYRGKGRWSYILQYKPTENVNSTCLEISLTTAEACPQSWPLLRSTYKASGSSRKRLNDISFSHTKDWDYISQQPLWFKEWSPCCRRRRMGKRNRRKGAQTPASIHIHFITIPLFSHNIQRCLHDIWSNFWQTGFKFAWKTAVCWLKYGGTVQFSCPAALIYAFIFLHLEVHILSSLNLKALEQFWKCFDS